MLSISVRSVPQLAHENHSQSAFAGGLYAGPRIAHMGRVPSFMGSACGGKAVRRASLYSEAWSYLPAEVTGGAQ